jgi:tRNA(Ile)-lysidine synthase
VRLHANAPEKGFELKVYTAEVPQGSRIEEAVAAALGNEARVVLAVSGGLDSMTLLDAAFRVARDRIVAVATFDHGTGAAAQQAVQLVRDVVRHQRLMCVTGRADGHAVDEDSFRRARLSFLGSVAKGLRARVATAHTLDDQVETVCMRILRDAGARGLAGMYAPGDVIRPLLTVSRAEVRAYAARRSLRHVEDPTNASPRYFRNRVRNDLLPALERARPGFSVELLRIAEQAMKWRSRLEEFVDTLDWHHADDGALSVGADPLIHLDLMELRTLWPAIGARGGIRFDRRGTERLASFTKTSTTGATMQLSGGFDVRRERQRFVLRRR